MTGNTRDVGAAKATVKKGTVTVSQMGWSVGSTVNAYNALMAQIRRWAWRKRKEGQEINDLSILFWLAPNQL